MNTLDKENSFPVIIFRPDSRLFFDTDTKKTFTVTKEQWQAAKRRYAKWATLNDEYVSMLSRTKQGPLVRWEPHFIIETETGTHMNWIYDTTEDYSRFLK